MCISEKYPRWHPANLLTDRFNWQKEQAEDKYKPGTDELMIMEKQFCTGQVSITHDSTESTQTKLLWDVPFTEVEVCADYFDPHRLLPQEY